jgi:hypothetical protein
LNQRAERRILGNDDAEISAEGVTAAAGSGTDLAAGAEGAPPPAAAPIAAPVAPAAASPATSGVTSPTADHQP